MIQRCITWGMLMLFMGMAISETAAQDTTVNLCSARKGGIYHFVAEHLSVSLRGTGLEVRVVETSGSFDNLKRMEQGTCDAAMVQLDALMVYSLERASGRIKIDPPLHLYDEWFHLICRRDLGIRTVRDLLRGAERYTILTGERGSGSETTWRALTGLDRDYREIKTQALGGQEALDTLLAGGSAACMTVVIGALAPFMRQVDERGEALSLVPVDLFEFRDSELVDNRIYSIIKIPAGTYETLQAGLDDPEIETIAVGATLVFAKAWVRENEKAYDAFLRAVSEERPAIRKRLGG